MKKQKILPITRPTLEPYKAYEKLLKQTLGSGMLTMNQHGAELERLAAGYVGTKQAVAVSSCTAGLMLTFKYFNFKEGSEVILPSFTFCASALPLVWNNLKPVFADIDSETYSVDPKSIERLITKKTVAILATHVFGVVCDTKTLEKLARKHNIKLIFDAAHAFGSSRGGKKAGSFGDVEIFSCSPTKVLTTCEGGIVTTNDEKLAQFVRYGRNYGDDGTNDIMFAGLSARMSELNAAVGLRSFAKLQNNLKRRNNNAKAIMKGLLKIEPRLRFQKIPERSTTTYKDLSVYLDPKVIGYTRDDMHNFFARHGVMTRKYFYPPLHKQRAYKQFYTGALLPVTDAVSKNVLSLPLFAHETAADIKRIVSVFKKFSNHVTKK